MDYKLQRKEMELGRLKENRNNKIKSKTKNIVLTGLVAAIIIVATIVILWVNGAFLPGWIEWKESPSDTSFLKKGVKVQDTLSLDINHDGRDEYLVLCWRIGRYGERKPFWVKHDELKWSQHIYIYEKLKDDTYKPIWMASDIHTDVVRWEAYDDSLITTYTPDNQKEIWMWNSWGLEKLSEEKLKEYTELKEKKLAVGGADEVNEKNPLSEASDSPKEQTNELQQDNVLSTKDDLIEEETEDSVSIVMVGDILLHDGVTSSCKEEDGYNFDPLFENTKEVIENADIAIVNQEVIIGGEELRISGYPTFNAPYEVSDALCNAGFDVVCHGTNHALDRKKKGIINCLNYWKENHPQMAILGIHDSEQSNEDIYITTVDGLKIAILNYTYGTNGIPLPEGMPFAVDYIKKDKIASDLQYAEENADFTIVCPHWGIEYMLDENAEQHSLAEFMTENGADLIIGTHPHVIEPIKWIESENGNKALCYYSIGNFINWTSGRGKNVANRMVGGMAYVEIDCDDSDMINDYGVYPVVSHLEHTKGKVTTYFLQDYTEELASKNAITEQDFAFDLDYCWSLANEVFKEENIRTK